METEFSNEATETIEACIDTCNRLLEGERSAVATYDRVLEKFGDDPNLNALQRIRSEHTKSVELLEQNILGMGGVPLRDSGLWGLFANAVQKTANLFGEDSAVATLQKGEEKGEADYQAALDLPHLLPGCRSLICETLHALTTSHIDSLISLQEESVEETES